MVRALEYKQAVRSQPIMVVPFPLLSSVSLDRSFYSIVFSIPWNGFVPNKGIDACI